MTLADKIAEDAVNPNLFGNTDHFAAAVSYTPLGGAPFTFNAVLGGSAPDPLTGQRAKALTVRLDVPRALLAAVNVGGDKVNIGGVSYAVSTLLDPQNPACWPVEAVRESGRT